MDRLRVFTARKILTMDPGRPEANAIAVSGERIVSVGTLDSMKPWLNRHPHEIDDRFQTGVLMPGFVDPHTHLRVSGLFMGLNYVGPIPSYSSSGKVDPCLNRDDVLERLRQLVAIAEDPERPIMCWGYDPARHGGHLDRDMLDTISAETPIWVMCYAPHIVYTNSPMLALTKADTTNQQHGVGRYADGRLNGWFVETGAVALAMAPVQQYLARPEAGEEALRLLARAAVHNGVTTVADMGWGLMDFETEWADHHRLSADPTFPLRVALVAFEPGLRKKFEGERFAYLENKVAQNNSRLMVQGIKWINDGSYPSMTLKLHFPGYLDEDHGETGEVPWEELTEVMYPYWERGIQIHSHANGDETIGMTLDVLAELQERKPSFDHRFTIEHYSISTPAQAKRLSALGGGASVNVYFVHYRGLLHSEAGFGPDRSEATARLGSLERAGASFCIHSDYNLVVCPMAPLHGAWIAANRLAEDGETVMAPGERISLDRALQAITIDAAYRLKRDHEIGSLEAGKLADMAVLSDDPYAVGAENLNDIVIKGIISGGEVHLSDD